MSNELGELIAIIGGSLTFFLFMVALICVGWRLARVFKSHPKTLKERSKYSADDARFMRMAIARSLLRAQIGWCQRAILRLTPRSRQYARRAVNWAILSSMAVRYIALASLARCASARSIGRVWSVYAMAIRRPMLRI